MEELMAAYGRDFTDLYRQPYSRFEDLWKAYSVRTGLEKLEEELSRQRIALQTAPMADPDAITRELRDLEERAAEARRIIMDPERATLDDPDQERAPGVSSSGFRTDKWWETPQEQWQDAATEHDASTPDEGTPVAEPGEALLEDVLPDVSHSPGKADLEIPVEIEED